MTWDPNGALANIVREVLSNANKSGVDVVRLCDGTPLTRADLVALADNGPPGRRTVHTFVLYENVGRDGPGPKYRVVSVDHADRTPWRAGCCTRIDEALNINAIRLCMESDNRDALGFYLEGEVLQYDREEGGSLSERRFPVSNCPFCGGRLVFKLVRHIRRSYTARQVEKWVTETEWTHTDEEVPVPGVGA